MLSIFFKRIFLAYYINIIVPLDHFHFVFFFTFFNLSCIFNILYLLTSKLEFECYGIIDVLNFGAFSDRTDKGITDLEKLRGKIVLLDCSWRERLSFHTNVLSIE